MSHPYGGRSHYSVVIVGGGQAGLSLSHCLQQRGIDHLVIEKRSLVHTWRTQRWDSFCLVTPNWQCQLPGWGMRDSFRKEYNRMPAAIYALRTTTEPIE